MGAVLPTPWGHLITTYDMCDQVLRGRDWRVLDAEWKAGRGEAARWSGFAQRELSGTLQGSNPPDHTRYRRALGNVFGRSTLHRLHGPIAAAIDRLLDDLTDRLRDGGEADFVPVVGDRLPLTAIGDWLGIPHADHPELIGYTHDQAYALELLPSPSRLAAADEAARGLRAYFTAMIEDRRATPRDDVVSGWLRAFDEMTPDRETADSEVFHLVMFTFIAAVETTSSLLPIMLCLLDQHPEQLNRLRADPREIPRAIEEVLRVEPPVQIVSRFAGVDTELGGVQVAQGELVHVLVGSANHDPARTPEPDTFDFAREGAQLSPHLAFGGGIHYCLGAGLARQQAAQLLERLLERLPTLRVSSPPVWQRRVAFRRLAELRVSGR